MDLTLLSRLSVDQFVSGEALAAEAGCTRAAIAKRIATLREHGVLIEARSHLGYRLLHPYAWWHEQFASGSDTGIQVLASVDSTNHWMRERLQAARPGDLLTVVTDFQQAGRGRRGRAWLSLPGRQITTSWGICSDSGPFVWLGVALAVGVEVAAILRGNGWPVSLKWPNDLWMNERKLGGILVEMDAMTEGPTRLVVGLGLNERVLPEEAATLDREVAALADDNRAWSRRDLLMQLDRGVRDVLRSFPEKGLAAWRERWEVLDALAGRQVRFEQEGVWREGQAMGIDTQGALQVLLEDGVMMRCHAGDVSVRPR